MALSTELAAALADKPTLLEEANGLDAKAAKWTPDIEAALPKLSGLAALEQSKAALDKILGETKAASADKLLADFTNLKTINADLERQRAEWKKGGGAASGTPDPKDTPEFKALQEQLAAATTDFNTKLGEITKKLEATDTEKATAVKEKRDTDLKSAIVSAGAKHKIKDVEDEFLLLQAKGQVGYVEKDGKHVPFYYKLNEKGEKVDAGSADALMAHIAATMKHKVGASDKQGAGGQHGGTGGGGTEAPKTAADARRAFLSK